MDEKIKMLRTTKGSPNGLTVLLYIEGEEYPNDKCSLSDELKNSFLNNNLAQKVVREEKQENVPENKALDEANENKGALAKAKEKISGKKKEKRKRSN